MPLQIVERRLRELVALAERNPSDAIRAELASLLALAWDLRVVQGAPAR